MTLGTSSTWLLSK